MAKRKIAIKDESRKKQEVEKGKSLVSIDSIPDEILVIILSFVVYIRNRTLIRKVCKKWKSLFLDVYDEILRNFASTDIGSRMIGFAYLHNFAKTQYVQKSLKFRFYWKIKSCYITKQKYGNASEWPIIYETSMCLGTEEANGYVRLVYPDHVTISDYESAKAVENPIERRGLDEPNYFLVPMFEDVRIFLDPKKTEVDDLKSDEDVFFVVNDAGFTLERDFDNTGNSSLREYAQNKSGHVSTVSQKDHLLKEWMDPNVEGFLHFGRIRELLTKKVIRVMIRPVITKYNALLGIWDKPRF